MDCSFREEVTQPDSINDIDIEMFPMIGKQKEIAAYASYCSKARTTIYMCARMNQPTSEWIFHGEIC